MSYSFPEGKKQQKNQANKPKINQSGVTGICVNPQLDFFFFVWKTR